MSAHQPDRAPGRPAGVIHDIGYRPYGGERRGERSIAWWLYVTGLRNAYGFGRSGKSKVLPFLLVGLNLVPALVIVAVVVVTGVEVLPLDYATYALTTQILVSVFAAAQGPILFSRDLRHGSIVLYLARPLSSTTYALMRWAALATAILAFLLLPLLAMYAGSLLNGMDVSANTADLLVALVLVALLAAMLASVSGLFSALSVRRGFAVVGTIAVTIFGYGVVAAIQGISYDQDHLRVGEVAGLFSPLSLYAGDVAALTGSEPSATQPAGGAMATAYLLVSVLLALGGLALLVRRYRKVATR